MSKRVDDLLDKEVLRPFAALLYLAWVDGDLQKEECQQLRETLQRVKFPEEDARVIEAWLDGDAPPDANELAHLRQHQDAFWEGYDNAGTEREPYRKGFRVLKDALHIRAHVPPEEFAKTDFEFAALQKQLLGPERKIREEILERLCRAPFERVLGESKEDFRVRVLRWAKTLADEGYGRLPFEDDPRGAARFIALFESCAHFDLNLVVKIGVQFGLFGGSILNLGEKHQHAILEQVSSLELPGAFAMTERAHGSNVRDIETTATYDHVTQTIVVHTPNDAAHKEYIGNAARDGKMATVFAQLWVNNECHGVHAVLVPIRTEDGAATEGVRIEDCGEKMGLNGIDNGRLWFDSVRVPKSNLLSRFGKVDDAGQYSSPIASSSRRFFTMLGTLVAGRVSVASAAMAAAKSGLATAIRYGAQRRQFGDPEREESPILAYPSHKARLMPKLASAYVLHFATRDLVEDFVSRKEETQRELEGKAAILKAHATDFCTQTLQTARECCGGQGYLAGNLLSALKADTDVFTTFEGDNTVLRLMVAKGLLTDFKAQFTDDRMWSTARFIVKTVGREVNVANPFTSRDDNAEHLRDAEFQRDVLRYRETVLLRQVGRRLSARIQKGMPAFEAFLECQNHLLTLADAHGERVIFESARAACLKSDAPKVLDRLTDLYALKCVNDAAAWYFERGAMTPAKSKAMRREIEILCEEVAERALPLVDAFGIPDELLPPIAHRDGTVRLV